MCIYLEAPFSLVVSSLCQGLSVSGSLCLSLSLSLSFFFSVCVCVSVFCGFSVAVFKEREEKKDGWNGIVTSDGDDLIRSCRSSSRLAECVPVLRLGFTLDFITL